MNIHFQIEYFTVWGEELQLELLQAGNKAIKMDNNGHGIWYTNLELPDTVTELKYIYSLTTNGATTRLEEGCHTLHIKDVSDLTLFDRWKESAEDNQENRSIVIPHVKMSDKPLWRGAGVAIPVFSLRSEKGFGTGEFTDLIPLVDWAVKTGLSVIQTLPVNDTTLTKAWRDSYPYSANSSFALHPIYLNLTLAGNLSDKEYLAKVEKERTELNSLPYMDYERVLKLKLEYTDRLYSEFGTACMETAEFKSFFDENRFWLEPYSVYCLLRDRYRTADFTKWNETEYSQSLRDTYFSKTSPYYYELHKHIYIQYHLFKQLTEVKHYANSHGVLLKGDVPIGLNRNSVDCWHYPELFNRECQAGAPPDDFAVDGQKWGLPTYNWERMRQDGYKWFTSRFKIMSNFFNAYRIDHLLGFFRIWEIPLKYSSGLMGHFNPALPYSTAEIRTAGMDFNAETDSVAPEGTPETNVLFLQDRENPDCFHPRILGYNTERFKQLTKSGQLAYLSLHNDYFYNRNERFWLMSGMTKLSTLLASTDMLACGEDLGMIPSSVPLVMEKLRLLSLEVQRMPKEYGQIIGNPSIYPYMSVATTSTHDMSVLRQWLMHEMPHNSIITSNSDTPENCEEIIKSHLSSPAMLTILPLQDWLSLDGNLRASDPGSERINVPADPDNYWRWRMHISVESLLNATDLNTRIHALVTSTR